MSKLHQTRIGLGVYSSQNAAVSDILTDHILPTTELLSCHILQKRLLNRSLLTHVVLGGQEQLIGTDVVSSFGCL